MRRTDELLRRVGAVVTTVLTAKEFRERVLALLRAQIRFDGHVFTQTDPVTRVATSPHADVPMLPWARLPELIRWRYLTTVNRPDLMLGLPASSMRTATADPSESLMWRHVQRELGVHDTATITLGDKHGCWGFLELWRTSDSFSADELDTLTAVGPALTQGLREAVARTFVAGDDDLAPIGPAIVVLGPDLAVDRQTDAAGEALLRLLPPDQPITPIPAAAYNVAGALVAHEQGIPVGEPWSRVHLGGSRWVTVKASRLGADIAVSIEPSTPAERRDLFARAHRLSSREAQVLDLLAIGLESREVATQLFVSEHTVNDHVKAILAKAGARSRATLLARVVGAGGSP